MNKLLIGTDIKLRMAKNIFFIMILLCLGNHFSHSQDPIYVSVIGDIKYPGTKDLPVNTLQRAVELSRIRGTKRILIRGGRYYDVGIAFSQIDSGLTIENYLDERPELYGGIPIKNWRRSGNFYFADVPGTKNRKWDFRLLLVNNKIAPRARYPHKGSFTYLNEWSANPLPATEGSWDQKPTLDDRTILRFNIDDIDSLSIDNAELSVPHQWQESYCGVKHFDRSTATLVLSNPTSDPIGSFAKVNKSSNTFVVWNTEQGMSEPGQWYLDRTDERLYYWPKPKEEIFETAIIAPKHSSIFDFGASGIKNITIRGLVLQGTSNRLQNEYMNGEGIDAAVSGTKVLNLLFDRITFQRIGGSALKLSGDSITINKCQVLDAYGGGFYLLGTNNTISNSTINDIGILFKSSIGCLVGKSSVVRNCQLSNIPYSGIRVNGDSSIIERCTVSKVMQNLRDGAAIYTFGRTDVIVRNNTIHGDVNCKIAIYFDEKSTQCLAYNNLILNASTPIHCHLAGNISFNNNLFFNSGSQTISCQRSSEVNIDGNTFVCKNLIFNGHGQMNGQDGIQSFLKNKLVGLDDLKIKQLIQTLPINKSKVSIIPVSTDFSRLTGSDSQIIRHLRSLGLLAWDQLQIK